MRSRTLLVVGCSFTALVGASAGARAQPEERAPLALVSATLTVDGTSNLHAYSASTKTVRVTNVQLAGLAPGDVLQQALQPGGLGAFEVAVPVASLHSPKDGIDTNLHKALKAQEHPDITFRLRTLENGTGETPGVLALRARGTLSIAGVAREITLDVKAVRGGRSVLLNGGVELLMTDFGVTPPKAMLGMVTTDPRVYVRFYLVLTGAEE
jgi:polyisoprenoid-binding protein YceI